MGRMPTCGSCDLSEGAPSNIFAKHWSCDRHGRLSKHRDILDFKRSRSSKLAIDRHPILGIDHNSSSRRRPRSICCAGTCHHDFEPECFASDLCCHMSQAQLHIDVRTVYPYFLNSPRRKKIQDMKANNVGSWLGCHWCDSSHCHCCCDCLLHLTAPTQKKEKLPQETV